MSQTQNSTSELTENLDKILQKTFTDLKKRLNTVIKRREKKLLKQIKAAQKRSSQRHSQRPSQTSRTPVKKSLKNRERYHSSVESSDDDY